VVICYLYLQKERKRTQKEKHICLEKRGKEEQDRNREKIARGEKKKAPLTISPVRKRQSLLLPLSWKGGVEKYPHARRRWEDASLTVIRDGSGSRPKFTLGKKGREGQRKEKGKKGPMQSEKK